MKMLFLSFFCFSMSLFAAPATVPVIPANQAKMYKKISRLQDVNPDEALRIISKNQERLTSVVFDSILGNIFMKKGMFKKAEQAYKKALKKKADFLNVYENLARLYLQQGKYKLASMNFVEAIQLGGNTSSNWKNLGYSYLSLHRFKVAEITYEKALIFDSEDKETLRGLAHCYMKNKKLNEALLILGELSEKFPLDKDLRMMKANLYLELNKKTLALTELETARTLQLISPEGMILLGDMYYQLEMPEEAASIYLAAFAKQRLTPIQQLHCLEVLVQTGQLETAERIFKYIRFETMNHKIASQIYAVKADIYLAKNMLKSAEKYFEEALNLNLLNARALLGMADIYRQKKIYEKAVIFCERSERITGFAVRALTKTAEIYIEQKKYAYAANAIRKALLISDNPQLKKYLSQLEKFE